MNPVLLSLHAEVLDETKFQSKEMTQEYTLFSTLCYSPLQTQICRCLCKASHVLLFAFNCLLLLQKSSLILGPHGITCLLSHIQQPTRPPSPCSNVSLQYLAIKWKMPVLCSFGYVFCASAIQPLNLTHLLWLLGKNALILTQNVNYCRRIQLELWKEHKEAHYY